jgi:ferredoxin-type protein NapH
MRRRPLQPLDITLRHAKKYQLVRRSFLSFSVLLTFLLPVWHLHALDVEVAGLAGVSRWAALGRVMPFRPPPWVGAPTSIKLWGLELLDPTEALGVALFRGVSLPWVWSVLPGVLLVVALGRFFCGWACPYLPILAASNAARWVLRRVGFEPADRQVPRVTARVGVVGLLALGSVLGTQLVPLVYPPAVFSREVFRAVFYGSLGTGSLVVLGAFLFDTFVSRAGFCRSLCPGGALFSVLSSLSPLRVTNERAKCTDCTVCDVVCNLGQSPMTARLDEGCERCGKCIASCPTQALSWGVGRPPVLERPLAAAPRSTKPGRP